MFELEFSSVPIRLSIVQDKSNNPPSFPLSSSCSGKVDESSFYIGPYKFNTNSTSDIKTQTLVSAFLPPAGGIGIAFFSDISRGTNFAQIGFCLTGGFPISIFLTKRGK
jgi:hypothetical protein